MNTVGDILRESAEIFDERAAIYGDNWIYFGDFMAAAFPRGVTIETAEEWRRLGLLIQIAYKFTRSCQAFKSGGHGDSTMDSSVYNAMLTYAQRLKDAKTE